MNPSMRVSPEVCAREVCIQRYPGARAAFLAGSIVRGEGTAFSDLDLVVVFERLSRAHRESFVAQEWPVEAFVHDPATLNYFMSADRVRGVPTLAAMIVEGIEVPHASELSQALKQSAAELLRAGPPLWSEQDRAHSRYIITDVVEDLRAPRSAAEFHASAARLYEMLANHFCRSRGTWSARGKSIVRRLQGIDSVFAERFTRAFETALTCFDAAPLIALAQVTLQPDGGFLFDGYRAEAPENWRLS